MKDKYERTVTFNLHDIGDIAFDPKRSDAEGVIFVGCRDGKDCIENQ